MLEQLIDYYLQAVIQSNFICTCRNIVSCLPEHPEAAGSKNHFSLEYKHCSDARFLALKEYRRILAVPDRVSMPVQNLYLLTCASQGELTASPETNTIL